MVCNALKLVVKSVQQTASYSSGCVIGLGQLVCVHTYTHILTHAFAHTHIHIYIHTRKTSLGPGYMHCEKSYCICYLYV